MSSDSHIRMFLMTLIFAIVSCGEKVSCVDDEMHPIEFSVSEYVAEVKGVRLTDSNLEDFGVFAALGNIDEAFVTDEDLISFINNVKGEKNGEHWGLNPKYYWPVNDDYDISFFAYAPYVESGSNGNVFSAAWDEKTISMTYTPSLNSMNQADLMIAEAVVDKYKESIPLVFNHVLAWVSFGARFKSKVDENSESRLPDGAYLRIDTLALKGLVGTNTLTYTKDGYVWNSVPETGTAKYALSVNGLTLGDVALEEEEYKEFATDEGSLFLLPQQIAQNTVKLCVTFSYVRNVDNVNEIIGQFYVEKYLPESLWEMGKKVKYNFTIDITTSSIIEIAAVSGGTWIVPWDSPDDVTVPRYPIQ